MSFLSRLREDIDTVLEPGDCLYLPRGWLHSAVAQGGTSIHLTIGLRATTRHDLLVIRIADADPLQGEELDHDVVDVDAPREIASMARTSAKVARDVAAFGEAGYRLAGIRGFDAFPMTQHVECVALLVPAA